MADLDATPPAPDWSEEDRNVIRWFAALPAVGSAIFALAIFPTEPSWWVVAFPVTAIGAYATAFLGVMPLLFAFRRYRWTRLVHYAVAGFAGFLLPWFIVGAFAEHLSSGDVKSRIGQTLLIAATIGAAMTVVFGWRHRRHA